MLQIEYSGQYRKKATATTESKLVFVFTVKGDKKEIAEYKKIKGANYKENDSKVPIFFTTRFAGQTAELRKTADGTDYVADTSRMDQIISLTQQGVPLELAERMAATPGKAAPAAVPAED
jgi:maltose-binding protein MalE